MKPFYDYLRLAADKHLSADFSNSTSEFSCVAVQLAYLSLHGEDLDKTPLVNLLYAYKQELERWGYSTFGLWDATSSEDYQNRIGIIMAQRKIVLNNFADLWEMES